MDRHIFVKRVRVWLNADGFISQLNADNLVDFRAGPPAVWRFRTGAGDGRIVPVELRVGMVPAQTPRCSAFITRRASPPTGGKCRRNAVCA